LQTVMWGLLQHVLQARSINWIIQALKNYQN